MEVENVVATAIKGALANLSRESSHIHQGNGEIRLSKQDR